MSMLHDEGLDVLDPETRARLLDDQWCTAFPEWAARVAATDPVIVALEELGVPSEEHTARPTDRERRQHRADRQERAARAALAPRTGLVEVRPVFTAHNDDGSALERRAA